MYAQTGMQKIENQRVKAGFGVAVVQTQPEFPGGDENLSAFLIENIKYPHESKVKGISGRVYVGFLIDKNGKLSHERVLSGVNDELDSEAIRVVRTMPDWKPGTQGGQNVDIQYILAIDFVLPPRYTEE
jgi:TonB family protein